MSESTKPLSVNPTPILDPKSKAGSSPQEIYALAVVALSAILYGFLGFFGIHLLNEHFSVSSMLFWRFFIATLGILFFGFSKVAFSFSKVRSFQKLIKPFLLGALFYSGGAALYFMACQYTGTGLAMVIFFSYPLFVALFVWLKNLESMNKTTVFSLTLIMLGLILLKGEENKALNTVGILLALGAALCYAIYVFNSKKILSQLSAEACTLIVCFSCTLVFLGLAYGTQSLSLPHTAKEWGFILALGILTTALPIHLLLKGIQVTGPIKASILSVLEPVVTIVVGVSFLGEIISPIQTVGILVLMIGALTVQWSRN
jgi:drug/metabolite transporter (DMT)-like permease